MFAVISRRARSTFTALVLSSVLAALVVPVPPASAASALSRIVYSHHVADNDFDIRIVNEDGSGGAALTAGTARDGDAAWAPDASRIAFSRTADPDGVNGIYLVNPDGTGLQHISNTTSGDASPTWSPDGSEIAFVRDGGIWTIAPDGTGLAQVTAEGGHSLHWSPRGTHISFSRFIEGSGTDIWDVDVTTATTRQLTTVGGAWGQYNHDGTEYAFTNRSAGQRTYVAPVNPDGSFGVPVPIETPDAAQPTFNADSTKLAVESLSTYYRIATYNRDGSGFTYITNNQGGDYEPDWEPVSPAVDNVTLSVDRWIKPGAKEGPAGITHVPVADIDPGSVPLADLLAAPLRSSPLRSSPLRSSDLASTPLRSSPLLSSPLRSSPLRSSPLRSSPLRSSPLRSSPVLANVTLAEVPLGYPGGWEAVIPTTSPFAGLPLQSVLLRDVLAYEPEITGPDGPLTLADIDLEASPLRSSTIQGFLFGGPTLAELTPTRTRDDWCGALSAAGYTCAASVDVSTTSLTDLDLDGAPLHAVGFLPAQLVTASGVDLTGAPVWTYDLASVDVDRLGLGGVPLTAVDGGAGEPDLVDCSSFGSGGCTDRYLTDAIAPYRSGTATSDPGHIRQDATLGALLTPTIAPSVTFGDVLAGVVDPAKLSFADVPLETILAAAPIPDLSGEVGGEADALVTYTLSADVRCDEASFLGFAVSLPDGFRYVPGDDQLLIGGEPVSDPYGPTVAGEDSGGETGGEVITEPYETVAPGGGATIPDGALVWSRPDGVTCGATPTTEILAVAFSFAAQPGAVLGPHDASAIVLTQNHHEGTSGATYGVQDAFPWNDEPGSATPASPGQIVVSHLGDRDAIDHFEISAQPVGSTVTVVLSHLPADYDLFVVDGPSGTPLRSSPLRSSPLRSSPLRSSGIEDEGVEPLDEDQTVAPDTLQDTPLRSSPLRSSANRSTQDEVVSAFIQDDTTPLTIAVTSYNGAGSELPYTLQIIVDGPPVLDCENSAPGTGGVRASALEAPGSLTPDGGPSRVFLFNQERFGDVHGTAAADQVRDELAAFSTSVDGVVLSVDAVPSVAHAYEAWDQQRCGVAEVNAVVRAINDAVESYRTRGTSDTSDDLAFSDVTIVGDDDIVPFARVLDQTTLSNQRDYRPEAMFGGKDNPLSAAFAYGMVLSDNAYGDRDPVEWFAGELPIPDIAVGRLVETPKDILDAVSRFQATGGTVTIDGSLSSGYDFLADAATEIAQTFTGYSTTRTLISNDGDALHEDWDRADLDGELRNGPDLAFVGAHFDHANALPAKGDTSPTPVTKDDLYTSDDLGTIDLATLPAGFVLFTLGCNSGVNIPAAYVDATSAEAARAFDFAESMARRQAGGYVANLGYGYGDTVLLAYSERLMSNFAEQLYDGNSLGQALVEARKDYLGALGLPGVYDAKVATEATFYGLPFTTVSGGAGSPPAPPAPVDVPDAPGTFGSTGIPSSSFDATFTGDFAPQQVTTARGSYDRIPGWDPLAVHYRPVQPATVLPLPDAPAGRTLGDVWITGLASTDRAVADAAFSLPTTDESEREPEVVADVAFPAALWNFTFDGDLALLPGSFRSDPADPDSGTQRTYSRMTGEVLFDDAAAPGVRPTIGEVEGLAIGSDATFRATIDDADQVVAVYQVAGDAVWRSAELVQGAPGEWFGGAPDTTVAEFFVQARNGARVSFARGKGLNYVPTTVQVPEGAPAVSVTGESPSVAGWFAGPVNVEVTGAETVALDGVEQPSHSFVVSGDGVHRIVATAANGAEAIAIVPIDTTGPTVTGVTLGSNPIPIDGSTTLTAVPVDLLSGAASGQYRLDGGTAHAMTLTDGSLSATVGGLAAGVYRVEVRATDTVGNTGDWADGGLLAVYDPDGGFVTGGGWIDSPAGAYRADQTLTGRANFGFVSKYQKGATTPSGKTEFQFKAGGFSFFSDSYQWLVVSGHKAQYKGTGSVNGTPGYGFLLTVDDGQATGGDGTDRFRIKVWNLLTEEIVYDNAHGASDDMDEAQPQPLGGGSVVIHTKKK